MEFLDTVHFCKKKGIHDRQNVIFCLGWERKDLILADFALRTKLYLPSEVRTESYTEFIAQCLTSS